MPSGWDAKLTMTVIVQLSHGVNYMKCPTSDSHKMSLKSDIDPILFFLRSEMISRLTLYTLKPNWSNFVFFLLPPICPLCGDDKYEQMLSCMRRVHLSYTHTQENVIRIFSIFPCRTHSGHMGGSRKKTKFLQLGFKVYKVNLEIISDLRKKKNWVNITFQTHFMTV